MDLTAQSHIGIVGLKKTTMRFIRINKGTRARVLDIDNEDGGIASVSSSQFTATIPLDKLRKV